MSGERRKRFLHRYVPIIDWVRRYDAEAFRHDLIAGATVGVMIVPQSMAYALLAGMPAVYGLYASFIPLLIYPLFATSRHLACGVIAVDMLIVAAGLSPMAEGGSELYVALAMMLAVMVGVIQVLMGLLRLGFIVNFLSRPVLLGFMTAAPLIIGMSQLGNLLGMEVSRSSYVHLLAWEVIQSIAQVDPWSVAIGVGGIVGIFGFRKIHALFPDALAVVVLSTAIVWIFGLDARGVAIIGSIEGGLPTPKLPTADVSFQQMRALFPTALTLALVQFMSVMSLSKVFAAREKYGVRANQELIAVGLANVGGSLFRSMPVSGSFSRSAVNWQSGARTPMANVVAAALVALTLLALTEPFAHVPKPTLAAIIIVSAMGMIDVSKLSEMYKTKPSDGYVAAFTVFTTLVVGIQEGVLLGIAATVVLVVYRAVRPHVVELGRVPGTDHFRDQSVNRAVETFRQVLVLRVDASFRFTNAEYITDTVLDAIDERDDSVEAVILDGRGVNDVDTTATAAIHMLLDELEERGIDLYLVSFKAHAREVLDRAGVTERLGTVEHLPSPQLAIEHEKKRGAGDGEIELSVEEIRVAEAEAFAVAEAEAKVVEAEESVARAREGQSDRPEEYADEVEKYAQEVKQYADEVKNYATEVRAQADEMKRIGSAMPEVPSLPAEADTELGEEVIEAIEESVEERVVGTGPAEAVEESVEASVTGEVSESDDAGTIDRLEEPPPDHEEADDDALAADGGARREEADGETRGEAEGASSSSAEGGRRA